MSSTRRAYSLLFDGGKTDNTISYGYIIKDPDGNVICSYGDKISFHSGNLVDNNHAEFFALMMGISECIRQNIRVLDVYGDSAHVIEIMNKKKSYRGNYTKFSKLVVDCISNQYFDEISFTWIPRKENSDADRLGR
jgi:ribonuclease HI